MNENWPFLDITSGALLNKDDFYGFSDAGGIVGYNQTFKTRESCIEYSKMHHSLGADSLFLQIGTLPDELGEKYITVLTGQEFVDEIKKRGIIDELGRWSEE